MYKLHLILKYLRKRRIAWVALIAVTLCTAMVLIVISVMGGWLRMFREINHSLIGDLIVFRQSLDGFGHYQEMIDQIGCLPGVKAAAPEIHTFGLALIGDTRYTDTVRAGVEVVGLDLSKIKDVTGFAEHLYLQPDVLKARAAEHEQEAAEKEAKAAAMLAGESRSDASIVDDAAKLHVEAQRLLADAQALRVKAADFPSFDKAVSAQTIREEASPTGKSAVGHIDEAARPGIIVGTGVIGFDKDTPREDWLYSTPVKLTVLKSSASGDELADQRSVDKYWIVDDCRTGIWQIDQNTVYVNFETLQKDLQMDAYSSTDAFTGAAVAEPAKCNQIQISLKEGYTPEEVKPKVDAIVQRIVQEYGMVYPHDAIRTQTWEENRADILEAVEHEKTLLVVLFSIISVVAIFLIFCIFYMVVVEKTRDIGIIKSVGATGAGVAAIFVGYGLTIGVFGGGMGLLLGYLVVHNINQLNSEVGKLLGSPMWTAKTYVFDTIPSTLNPREVTIIVSVAIVSAVLGALIPAIRAARMNPVEALRWE